MDFYTIKENYSPRKKLIDIYPDFKICRSKDLMVRGGKFYAIWDEKAGKWSTDEYDVARLIDDDLYSYANEKQNKADPLTGIVYNVMSLTNFKSKVWTDFKNYLKSIEDNSHDLDNNICFMNSPVERKDYISKFVGYNLEEGDYSAYDQIIGTLYSEEERRKLEWAIGAIITGDASKIQKFIVLYGDPGTGKSTILEIIQKLFKGYYSIFDAKSLTSGSNAFSTEQFANNPLIAIQHDGDLSKIEDNSILNSIVSHESIQINEKYKKSYPMKMKAFLFMATNKPVKITDGKAGLIRRLIDVNPSGNKLPTDLYYELMDKVEFELGAIAWHCKEIYEKYGKNYYNSYRPVDMMYKTDPFFNFVEDNIFIFEKGEGVALKQTYKMYKDYCQETNASYVLQMYKFREELKNYFKNFDEVKKVDGIQVRSWYSNFDKNKFDKVTGRKETSTRKTEGWIDLKEQKSLLDDLYLDCPAQYSSNQGLPTMKWDYCNVMLGDLDTKREHYVKVPENLIVIDFDIRGEDGNKCLKKNIEAANKWPKTYVETSKSGEGLHLHYLYSGDSSKLSRIYDENIEIKVFNGNASLRRKVIKCNDIPIATISSGLPLKEKGDNKVVNFEGMKNEKAIRTMIKKNLNKEYHANTKPSVDFIFKILEDAYNSGATYDVRDMRQAVLNFAMRSSNQAEACIKLVNTMKFNSDDIGNSDEAEHDVIVFYDVEVFPNLFLVNWKKLGSPNVVRMINPKPHEIEELCKFKLVGFNCRRYDNHMLYARMMGYSEMQLFKMSQKIVSSKKGENNDAFFGEAWNLSYTDIYDYSTKKQSLKKWEIELSIHHQELGLPWDQPVDESLWNKVAEYCDNDVIATEAVWNATKSDFKARQILVSIAQHAGANACVNDTTNSLTTKIIFGKEKKPELVYTDLATGKTDPPEYQRKDIKTDFPGYRYIPKKESKDGNAHNLFKGEEAGFGGYVYAEPGIYGNVALLDIASMHPTSIECMNCFGEYTKRFSEIKAARIYIKHKEFDKAREMLDGALAEYLDDEEAAKDLSTALKIPINSVYGLTSAKFPNPFRDERNDNNIVALRGALFMILLKHEVQAKGFTVAHIKTDSIKVPDATPEIIDFIFEFGKEYGYTFEHEATYEKMCIVNDSTYVSLYSDDEVNGSHKGEWTATAAQFQQPYVFKTLFTHEPIEFEDMCETKEVKSSLYLDMNEKLPNHEEELKKLNKELDNYEKLGMGAGIESCREKIKELESEMHDYKFVGKVGNFCPIKQGCGGGELVRDAENGKFNSATGCKGYRWLESETVKLLNKENDIDRSYYQKLVDDAYDAIDKHGDAEWFCSDKKYNESPFVGGKII